MELPGPRPREEIPVISFKQPRDALICAVRTACLTHGFFQLTSHPVPLVLQQTLLSTMRQFFALPTDSKSSLAKDGRTGGYERFQSYSLESSRGKKDLNEGFSVAPEFHQTLWPEHETVGVEMRAVCREYYRAVEALGRELGGVIAEGLGLDRGYFDAFFERQESSLRLIHYFRPESARREEPEELGAGRHSDWGLLTLLLQDEVGGLQVFDPATESYIDVPPVSGALVINVGDLLMRFTNGVYTSSAHRVVAPPPGVDRYSAPFFCDGNPEYEVDVLPLGREWKEWVGDVREEKLMASKKWEKIRAGDYFQQKFLESLNSGTEAY